MKRPLGKIAAAFFVLVLATGAATHAQAPTFTVQHSFTGPPGDGAIPVAGLLRDAAGNLYGGTAVGGASTNCTGGAAGNVAGCGTVFKLDTSGNESVLHSFNGSDGADSYTVLIMDSAGNL